MKPYVWSAFEVDAPAVFDEVADGESGRAERTPPALRVGPRNGEHDTADRQRLVADDQARAGNEEIPIRRFEPRLVPLDVLDRATHLVVARVRVRARLGCLLEGCWLIGKPRCVRPRRHCPGLPAVALEAPEDVEHLDLVLEAVRRDRERLAEVLVGGPAGGRPGRALDRDRGHVVHRHPAHEERARGSHRAHADGEIDRRPHADRREVAVEEIDHLSGGDAGLHTQRARLRTLVAAIRVVDLLDRVVDVDDVAHAGGSLLRRVRDDEQITVVLDDLAVVCSRDDFADECAGPATGDGPFGVMLAHLEQFAIGDLHGEHGLIVRLLVEVELGSGRHRQCPFR